VRLYAPLAGVEHENVVIGQRRLGGEEPFAVVIARGRARNLYVPGVVS
jgi:hypothetical protein